MDDHQLQHAVAEELEWAPHVDASDIVVTVRDGIVRLSGSVRSLAEKRAAEHAVRHVRGVRSLIEELRVLVPETRPSDDEVTHRVKSVLRWDAQVPSARIHVQVKNGIVTLTGSVDWQFERTVAEDHVHRLAGVLGVSNRIVVHPSSEPTDIKDRVQRAFRRHARLHAAGITIEVDGRKVTLTGQVASVEERNTAENAAWSAAGVAEVEDRLVVSP